jgi:putative drug exporter of the RND superfamily
VRDTELFRDLSLDVAPRGAVVLHADDPRAARGALLALSGRVSPTAGRLRVAGHLLPGREAWVRSHVAVARLDADADPVGELRRAFAGRPGLVGLEGLDVVAHGILRDDAAEILHDAAAHGGWTLLATAGDPSAARTLLSAAGWRDTAVLAVAGPTASRTSPLAEVNA